jgi:beta-galactosidase
MFDRFHFGVCFYPEHWDEATRRDDAKRMADAGMNVVRMAEFAWNVIEPRPGTYDFSLFDDTIARLGEHGIDTILCTPTATPPRWLLKQMPDMVRINAKNVPMTHGSRQHVSHAHEGFQQASRDITQVMAEHWKSDPHVIGWQTDNEFHCHIDDDYSPAALVAFQRWCEQTYGDIDTLNRRWGTAFWSQTFDAFEDVTLPIMDTPTYLNPAHRLAYFRFLGDLVTTFQADQVKILRETNANWWITHNGLFKHIDYRGQFTKDLDVLGWDVYPMFFETESRHLDHAFNADRCRGMAGNFIVPEHQSGSGGQPDYMLEQPLPDEMRQMSLRTIARGCDSLLYFRWRTCRTGAEQYWLGIIDHDNIGRRRYDEVARVGEDVAKLKDRLLGSTVAIDAAVASCSTDIRDAHAAYTLDLPDPDDVAAKAHAALSAAGFAPGCVHPEDDLDRVGVYVVPHWAMFDPAWATKLTQWVEAGGLLIVGARTATRDLDNNIVAETPPGVLAELCGVKVVEYGPLKKGSRTMTMTGHDQPAARWYETLDPTTAEPLATWQDGPAPGAAAVTMRHVGKGRAVYVGTYLHEPVLAPLLRDLVADLPRLRPADLPASVELVIREKPNEQLWFYFNNAEAPVAFEAVDGSQVELDRFGVHVVVHQS